MHKNSGYIEKPEHPVSNLLEFCLGDSNGLSQRLVFSMLNNTQQTVRFNTQHDYQHLFAQRMQLSYND